MTNSSDGQRARGARATELAAPLVLVVLVLLGAWWYLSLVGKRVEREPTPPKDLRQSFPSLPGPPPR